MLINCRIPPNDVTFDAYHPDNIAINAYQVQKKFKSVFLKTTSQSGCGLSGWSFCCCQKPFILLLDLSVLYSLLCSCIYYPVPGLIFYQGISLVADSSVGILKPAFGQLVGLTIPHHNLSGETIDDRVT